MIVKVESLALPELKIVRFDVHADERGAFAETWDRRSFAAIGIADDFAMDGWSSNAARGTVRGLHFQTPPHAQAKLVSVGRGRIFDVAVDLRRGSPTFGRHASVVLDVSDRAAVYVPVGFAHGFCTLAADTEVLYKMSDHYSPRHAMGVAWDDPDLGIAWPVSAAEAVLSARDRKHPRFKDLGPIFP